MQKENTGSGITNTVFVPDSIHKISIIFDRKGVWVCCSTVFIYFSVAVLRILFIRGNE